MRLFLLCISFLFLVSCTKNVDLSFPDVQSEIVVDGRIEMGQPPLIFLTRTQSFNAPLNASALAGIFVHDAIVTVSNGTDTIQLQELCAATLEGEELILAAELLGVTPEDLLEIEYCVYTDLTLSMIGEEGVYYFLDIITAEAQVLRAETLIPQSIPLDSLWFEFWAASDSLGFLHAELSDPASTRNAYRWWAQRTNKYSGTQEQKDFGFIAPIGSVFEDSFFDGLTFEFIYNRGSIANSNKLDDTNEEAGFFKLNDTVTVKFAATTLAVENYISISDDQFVSTGSPFAIPTNLPSNVQGGKGLWAGYAPLFFEVICVP